MNPNLPAIGKYSSKVIDRDALCRAFQVPAGLRFNDRTINRFLAQTLPGMDDYQPPDTLDMDVLRRCLANGANASVEAINQYQSLSLVADALDGNGTGNDAASPVVPAPAAPAVIGMGARGSWFWAETAARLRAFIH